VGHSLLNNTIFLGPLSVPLNDSLLYVLQLLDAFFTPDKWGIRYVGQIFLVSFQWAKSPRKRSEGVRF